MREETERSRAQRKKNEAPAVNNSFSCSSDCGKVGYYYWSTAHTYVIPSIDGPFYYLQVNSILHTGTVVYPDPPISFYAFTLFALLLGNTVTGVIVGSAVFAAAASVAVFFLFRYFFKSYVPAIAAGLVCTLSAEHLLMAANLMKNAVGIVFIVGVIFFLQRILDSDKNLKLNMLGVIGFFTLTMLSHILDEGIALLFIAFYLVFSVFFAQRRKLLVRYGAILGVTSLMAVSVFLFLPDYFGDFDKGISFFSAVSSSSLTAQLGGPASAGMGVTDYFVYVILAVGVGLSIYGWIKDDRKKAVLLISATVMGVLLVLPNIPSDFAWRFQLMEFIPAAIIVGYAFAMLKRRGEVFLALLAVVLLIVPVAFVGFNSVSAMTPTISERSYADLQHMATLVSSNNSVLMVGGLGSPYWSQFVFDLPVVSNSTEWLQKGYNIYVLVSEQGQGQGNTPSAQNPQGNGLLNLGGFGGTFGQHQPDSADQFQEAYPTKELLAVVNLRTKQ